MVLEFLRSMLEFYQDQLTKELSSNHPSKDQVAWYKKQIKTYKMRITKENNNGVCINAN